MALTPPVNGRPATMSPARLRRKALARIVRLQGLLAALLFLPAWSLRSWHAWAYLSIFSGGMLAITWYFLRHDPGLVESRLRVGPGVERDTRHKAVQAVADLAGCLVIVVSAIERRVHAPTIPIAFVLVADAMVAAGFAIVFRAFRENGDAASAIRVAPGQQVVATGPYGVVRHPMYAGSLLVILATPVALGTPWAFSCAVPLCAAVVVRLLQEERYLTDRLDGYGAYCRTVRDRLVPHVW